MAGARVCVFAGSQLGANPAFEAAARQLGQELAHRRIGVVYGGASVGLMAAVADAALAAGGEVVGVIPRGVLRSEVGHPDLTDLRVVGSMHERKALMADLADGFIALPGGLGTFEELLEQMTWNKLGIHAKPVVALDLDGFYEPLFALLERAQREAFLITDLTELVTRAVSVESAIQRLELSAGFPTSAPKASDSR